MAKLKQVADEREKVWQRLLGTHILFEVKSIRIIESNIFVPQTIELNRVVALIGLHGTGKTAFLRMLEAAFGYITPVGFPPFVRDEDSRDPSEIKGIIEVELNTPGGRVSRQINLEQPASERLQIWKEATGNSLEASYISPLYLFMELYLLYQDFDFYRPTKLTGMGKHIRDGKLKVINQILGRSYRQIWVYSKFIEETQGAVYVPHIMADTVRGVIDASMMSQGELWVNYVLNWFLDDDIGEGSLALLDEPEAFLAARAQRPFIDQVARQALAKNLQIIIATHSPELLVRLPLTNMLMCVKRDDGMLLMTPKSMSQVREGVGLQTPIRMLILVEDKLAKRILSSLFSRYDRALTSETELAVANGAEQAINGLKALQNTEKIVCLGVLDADKRKSLYADGRNILFLPGVSSPEEEMLSKASHNASQTADRLNVSIEDFTAAISLCLGLDHHYWIKTIAASLGFAEEALEYELIQLWLEDMTVKKESEKLVNDIRCFRGEHISSG